MAMAMAMDAFEPEAWRPAWFVAVAAAGLVHGLLPGCGWPLVAARLHGARQRRRPDASTLAGALLAMALGHLASVALVAALAAWALDAALRAGTATRALGGLTVLTGDAMQGALQAAASVIALGWGWRAWRQRQRCAGEPRLMGPVAIAVWSFAHATAQGTGLMLLPALVPLCGTAGGSAPPGTGAAMAGLALHTGALLASAAAVAIAAVALPRREGSGRSAARPCGGRASAPTAE